MAEKDITAKPAEQSSSVTLLTLGGVAAAFGAASCCGIPFILATLGVSTAWLTGVATVAAPHRVLLLALGAAGLGGSGYLLLWRSRPGVCSPDSLCAWAPFRITVIAGWVAGLIFLYLGYAYA